MPQAAVAAVVAAAVVAARAAGGGGGGGGARRWRRWRRSAAGGGGARQSAQVNNSRADSRTNNVRSTSVNNVNNVNVDRNVNVNVEGSGGCCSGWDNDYHPVATAAAVGAAVAVTSAVIGSMVRSRAAKLRAGELRRHGLSAMRRHLVSAPGIAVRRGQSAVLIPNELLIRVATDYPADAGLASCSEHEFGRQTNWRTWSRWNSCSGSPPWYCR